MDAAIQADEIRFFLQKHTDSYVSSLDENNMLIFNDIVESLKSKDINNVKSIITKTLDELNYSEIPNRGDTVIWRIREAMLFNTVPQINTRTWEDDLWLCKLTELSFEIIARPISSSNKAMVLISCITPPTFSEADIDTLLTLGITSCDFVYFNEDDGKKIIVKRGFKIERKIKYTMPRSERDGRGGGNSGELDKLVMLVVASIVVYFLISVRKK